MKKIIIGILFISGMLMLVAMISLLRYDLKEKKWYNEVVTVSKKPHTDTTTLLCILGTVHQPTANYNADSIFSILSQFQPDLILTEEDTGLFENYHKSYSQTLEKPIFTRLRRSFGTGTADEIEGRAVRKYKISQPSVDIRPFDYEGRNAFYEKNKIFLLENEVGNMLSRLAGNHSLTEEQTKIWDVYGCVNDSLNQLTSQTPYAINQQSYYALAERRQDYQYHKLAEIVNSSDSLKNYREFYKMNAEFWDSRNKKMAEHIANFIIQYPNKRIIVLTGSMHKYYLLKNLAPLQNELKFRLREYYK